MGYAWELTVFWCMNEERADECLGTRWQRQRKGQPDLGAGGARSRQGRP
jgi:hypothetical protein